MMKKILSLIVAIAMVSSLVVVGVNAEDATPAGATYEITVSNETNPTAEKAVSGDSIKVAVKLLAGTATKIQGFGAEVTYDSTKLELDGTVTIKGILNGWLVMPNTDTPGIIRMAGAGMAAVEMNTEPVLEFTLNVKDIAETGTAAVSVAAYGTNLKDETSTTIENVVSDTENIAVAKSFTATSLTSSTTTMEDVELGTAKEDVIAALEVVEFEAKNDGGAIANVTAENWISADYDGNVAGTYTFEGTLKAENGVVAYATDVDKVTATVTINKLTLDGATVSGVYPEYKITVDATKTVNDVEAVVADANIPEVLTVTKNGISEELAIVWTMDPASFSYAEVGAEAVLTGAVDATSATNFTGEDADIVTTKVVIKKKPSQAGDEPAGIGTNVGGERPPVTPVDPEPTDPTDPTEPTEPTDPTDPTDPTTPVDAPFDDITEAHDWAVESITTLKELGVVNGKDGNNFEPDTSITRAEFAKMVVLVLGLEVGDADAVFDDCTADEWFTPYVAAAAKAGIVKGISETEFAPNETITRQDACTILGRALGLTAEEIELVFTDAQEVSDYAAEFVAALTNLGILNGYEDGSFAPANDITRAEAAKVLAGALKTIVSGEENEEEVTEEVVEETTEEVVEETTEETVEETTEEVAEETAEETVEETAEEVAE